MVLGIVIKSYFTAVGFAVGTGRAEGQGVEKLMEMVDANQACPTHSWRHGDVAMMPCFAASGAC